MNPRPPEESGGSRIRPFLAAPQPDPVARSRAPAAEEPEAGGLRPFVLTAGRVSGHADIGLHTQVTSRVDDLNAGYSLSRELRAIVALCAEPMSIAEISARVPLHLGVTKILVGDLRDAGYLDVHLQDTVSPHDAETILRVIDGLRAFS